MAKRMELATTVLEIIRVVGAVLAAILAVIVLYDLVIADVSRGKLLLHILYTILALAAVAASVIFWPTPDTNAYDAPQSGAEPQSN